MMNPRLASILRSDAHTMRFVAMAMARVLEQNDALDEVLDSMTDRAASDLTERVAGASFAHWYGKAPQDVRRELVGATHEWRPEDVDRAFEDSPDAAQRFDEIQAAMDNRGIGFTDDAPPAPEPPPPGEPPTPTLLPEEIVAPPAGGAPPNEPPSDEQKRQAAAQRAAAAPTAPNAPPARPPVPAGAPGATPPTEPAFGRDRIPLSQLRGKTDEDLLKYLGIGKKTIEDIRAAEQANPAVPPPAPPTPPEPPPPAEPPAGAPAGTPPGTP
jgi:hypothetical protein